MSPPSDRMRRTFAALSCPLLCALVAGCSGAVGVDGAPLNGAAPTGSGGTSALPGSVGNPSLPETGGGLAGQSALGTAGMPPVSATAGSGGVPSGTSAGGTAAVSTCETPTPGRTPLRRLTRFEYSNTVRALLGDDTDAGQRLPAELLGNGFGNDADSQPSSSFLIEQYASLADDLTAAAWASPDILSRYDACVSDAAPDEATCARSFLAKFGAAAYRRPLLDTELEEIIGLQLALREHGDFPQSIRGTAETMLQAPEFLYRVELGEALEGGLRRPTGHEMATRLSYFFWGSPPDEQLLVAAGSGALSQPAGVLEQAERLLDAPEARGTIRFFFDSYLPINALTDQSRDTTLFPTFNSRIGGLMHEETTLFLEHQIFEGGGTWDSILTAPFTFLNEELASFYGIPGIVGEEFQRVDLDTTKRLGLLTQGAVMTGTTVTNTTNPVRRGGFLLSHILCTEIPLPPQELLARVKPPEPYTGDTGRQRYTLHSQDVECASCHALLDPPGFALENFDAVGLWRDQENGVTIDASGTLAGIGTFAGPVELVQRVAESEATYTCFANQWQKFAYGRVLEAEDRCAREQLASAFEASGHNVKRLLLDITQTDTFLYLAEGAQE